MVDKERARGHRRHDIRGGIDGYNMSYFFRATDWNSSEILYLLITIAYVI